MQQLGVANAWLQQNVPFLFHTPAADAYGALGKEHELNAEIRNALPRTQRLDYFKQRAERLGKIVAAALAGTAWGIAAVPVGFFKPNAVFSTNGFLRAERAIPNIWAATLKCINPKASLEENATVEIQGEMRSGFITDLAMRQLEELRSEANSADIKKRIISFIAIPVGVAARIADFSLGVITGVTTLIITAARLQFPHRVSQIVSNETANSLNFFTYRQLSVLGGLRTIRAGLRGVWSPKGAATSLCRRSPDGKLKTAAAKLEETVPYFLHKSSKELLTDIQEQSAKPEAEDAREAASLSGRAKMLGNAWLQLLGSSLLILDNAKGRVVTWLKGESDEDVADVADVAADDVDANPATTRVQRGVANIFAATLFVVNPNATLNVEARGDGKVADNGWLKDKLFGRIEALGAKLDVNSKAEWQQDLFESAVGCAMVAAGVADFAIGIFASIAAYGGAIAQRIQARRTNDPAGAYRLNERVKKLNTFAYKQLGIFTNAHPIVEPAINGVKGAFKAIQDYVESEQTTDSQDLDTDEDEHSTE